MGILYKLRYLLFFFLVAPAFLGAPKEYLSIFLLLGLAILLTKGYESLKLKRK